MLPILKKFSDFCLYTKKSKDSLAKCYQKKPREYKNLVKRENQRLVEYTKNNIKKLRNIS